MEVNSAGKFVLFGRGELHLSVLIEDLRREGFELEVSKPQVVLKEEDGQLFEPVEELTIDVSTDFVGPVNAEVGKKKGVLMSQDQNKDGSFRLIFRISSRGMLGLRTILTNATKGTAIVNSAFLEYEPYVKTNEQKLRKGVLISSALGKSTGLGLSIAQGRGITFIKPQEEVYEGMIIGENSRDNDLEINCTKSKNLTNVRSKGTDDAIVLAPPKIMTLEQSLNYIEDDELVEVTPTLIRLRKKYLTKSDRVRVERRGA